MADENEDQWLYGDSGDVKDNFENNSEPQLHNEDANFATQDDSYPQNEEYLQNHEPDNEKGMEDSQDGQLEEESMETPNQIQQQNSKSNLNENEIDQNDTQENGVNNADATFDGQNQEEGEAASDSDSDDDVNVVIGDIKSTPAQYSSLNIKRGGLLSSGVPDKLKQQTGKFTVDEFESAGSINGIPAHEYNLDQLEEKPWRQPGADITDYFNYGFNEDTWRAYCERQKRMRSESGAGLVLNAAPGSGPPGVVNSQGQRVPQVTITNYNSKYSGIVGPKRAGPPPGRKMAGTIDVIGSTGLGRRNAEKSPPKENVIQVMTADRREYSRKNQPPPIPPPVVGFPDLSVPPPMPVVVPPGVVPPTFDMPPPGYPEPAPYFMPEPDPYYNSYEPTADRQWGGDPVWQPANITIPLAGGDMKDPRPKPIPSMVPPAMVPPMIPRDMRDRERDRDRDRDRDREREREREYESGRDRDRDRERERDRDREKESLMRERERDIESASRDEDRDRERSRSVYKHKDRHRHRSRSRSRRHKSRSRSPSRRKKKSRRSEREKSKEESE